MSSPARLLVCLLLAVSLLVGGGGTPATAQQRSATTTTVLLKGDRPTNYGGFTLIVVGMTTWAVIFGVVLYRSPRRASVLRRQEP